jgi:hypothetical protein
MEFCKRRVVCCTNVVAEVTAVTTSDDTSAVTCPRHVGLQMATAELRVGCSTFLAKNGADIEIVHSKWEEDSIVVNKHV